MGNRGGPAMPTTATRGKAATEHTDSVAEAARDVVHEVAP
jgi:hypothetical protein